MDQSLTAADIRAELAATFNLFAPIREKFAGPGVGRGGYVREGVVGVYVKKYGEYTPLIFPGIDIFAVEASFSEEQLRLINTAILALKEDVLGKLSSPGLTQRIIDQYLQTTQPYYMLAMLKAVEATIRETVTSKPQLAAVYDVLFRVAGSEGMRDLIRVYCAHQLEKTLEQAEAPLPDIMAFIDIHERESLAPSGAMVKTQYEVWCPGTDLAKAIFHQCQVAARRLVAEHNVRLALTLQEEVAVMPLELVGYLSRFVQQQTAPILKQYGLSRSPTG